MSFLVIMNKFLFATNRNNDFFGMDFYNFKMNKLWITTNRNVEKKINAIEILKLTEIKFWKLKVYCDHFGTNLNW
jgi:hypothetical protein